MIDPTTSVANIDRLRSRFGDAWPSFHDAEIIAIKLWRGDISPERESWVGPVITIKFQVLEATQPSATHSGDDTLVALCFHDCDDIKLNTFNHQNAINAFPFQMSRSTTAFQGRFALSACKDLA